MKNMIGLLTIGILTSTTTTTVIACATPTVKKAPHDITNINKSFDLGKLSSDTATDFLQKLNQKLKTFKGLENITTEDYYVDNADTKSKIIDADIINTNKLNIIISSKSSSFTGVTGIIKVKYIRTLTQQDTIYIDKDGLKQSTSKQNLSWLEIKKILQIGFYESNGEIKPAQMPKTILEVPDNLPREITSLASMFADNEKFNQDLSQWDVSNVTNMSRMFYSARNFNQDLSQWDVSNVTNMQYMFLDAYEFNGDISTWDTSKVTDMSAMFYDAYEFNRDISKWDVSNVTDMTAMFYGLMGVSKFNQDLSQWNVSNVIDMHEMFSSAINFNQDISKWDVSSVTNMSRMFMSASSFNQDISKWDVSNVTDMQLMFYEATKFNQDLSNWNVAKVTSHDNFADKSGITSAVRLPKWKD